MHSGLSENSFNSQKVLKFRAFVCVVCKRTGSKPAAAEMELIHREVEKALVEKDITRGSVAHTREEERITQLV